MSESYLNIFLFEQAKVFEPLKRLNEPIYFSRFTKQIGFDNPFVSSGNFAALTQSITDLERAIDEIKANPATKIEDVLLKIAPSVAGISSALLTKVPEIIRDGGISISPETLFVRITDYLICEYLTQYRYKAFVLFHVLGMIETSPFAKVNWDAMPLLFTDINQLFQKTYEWNDNFNGDEFLKRLSLIVSAFSLAGGIYRKQSGPELKLPLIQKGVYPDRYTEFDVNVLAHKEGLIIYPSSNASLSLDFDLRNNWYLEAEGTLAIGGESVGIEIRPPANLKFIKKSLQQLSDLDVNYQLELKIDHHTLQDEKIFILGDANNTNLYLKKTSFSVFLEKTGSGTNAGIECSLSQFGLSVGAGSGDSFLSFLLPPAGFGFESDLTIGYSTRDGLYLVGGSLEIKIPLHIEIGPVSIDGLLISVKPDDSGLPVEFSTTIKGELGPLMVIVENIGIRLSFIATGNGRGLIGPFNLEGGFKPPTGVGISIDAAIIKGGGFLQFFPDKGEYNGILQLNVQGFLSLTAIGLIQTKPYFSMLIIITAEFNPPFQLSYGFTLIGVGGLLGLNRMVLLDPLRDGVRNGAINSIMFPTDPIANAPRIISDLQAIFPPREGYFLIGPMAKIGWGTPTLISLSLGVIIQLPDPKIAILGVLKIVLPTEEIALLKLQVNFLGTIDPAEKLITFDASLFDSNLLRTLTLTGDMAVRLKWGGKPDFILSAGGFHPAFEPTMKMPSLQRLGIKILDHENARIRVETYFAITSNTVQFGAKADCYFGIDDFSVSGDFGFDALMQFSPFTFEASCSGNFTLDTPLGDASIRVHALLKGPAPWYVKASGSIEVFGVEFEAKKTVQWGEERHDVLPEIALKGLFKAEMAKDEVWHTELPAGREQLVAITSAPAEDAAAANPPALRIHPFGYLVISQKMLPLGLKLDKFGNQKISDYKTIDISTVAIGTVTATPVEIKDFFAIAQFKNLSDAEKLSRPSFEKFRSGVKAGFLPSIEDFVIGKVVETSLEYEQKIIDKEPVKGPSVALQGQTFTRMLKGMASKRSQLSMQRKERLGLPRTVPLQQEEPAISYTIGNPFTNTPLYPGLVYASMAEADDAMKVMIGSNEALTGKLTLIEQI